MDRDSSERAERRRQSRGDWPVRAYRLGEEPAVDPLDRSTTDERLAMMWPLAMAAWAAANLEIPSYPRDQCPGRWVRK